MIVYGFDRTVADWVAKQLSLAPYENYVAIGVMRRGELVAGAVYNQYDHPNIQLSFASTTRRWATRDAVSAILRYPFRQLGCKRISCLTAADNERAISFMEHLGFRREGYHPDMFPGGDAISLGLLARDAERWIGKEEEHGQVERARAA